MAAGSFGLANFSADSRSFARSASALLAASVSRDGQDVPFADEVHGGFFPCLSIRRHRKVSVESSAAILAGGNAPPGSGNQMSPTRITWIPGYQAF